MIGDASASATSVEPASVTLNSSLEQNVHSIRLGGATANATGNLEIGPVGNLRVAQAVDVNNGFLDVNGSLEAQEINISGANASARFNGILTSTGTGVWVDDGGVLNIEAATISNFGLNASSGGQINVLQTPSGLSSFNARDAQTQISILANTTVPNILVRDQAKLLVSAELNASGSVFVGSGSTLQQNAGIIQAGTLLITNEDGSGNTGAASSFARNGGVLNVNQLQVRGNTAFSLGVSDQVNTLSLRDGASISTTTGRTFSGSVTVDAASLHVGGNLTADSLALANNANFSQNSGGTFSVRQLNLNNQSFHVTNGNSVSEDLTIANATLVMDTAIVGVGDLTTSGSSNSITFEDSSHFNFAGLFGTSDSITFRADATINQLLSFNFVSSQIVVEQSNGSLDGLTVGSWSFNGVSPDILLQFDSASGDDGELDWGLRLAGDQVTELQQMLDNGSILGLGLGSHSLSVIYDQANFGNWTHVGYFRASSVPEPSTIGIAGLVCVGMFVRRRRKQGRAC
ncbi:MAG: PEP-CTERM sorting domain-containing protein [Pirellulaceae bacterium]